MFGRAKEDLPISSADSRLLSGGVVETLTERLKIKVKSGTRTSAFSLWRCFFVNGNVRGRLVRIPSYGVPFDGTELLLFRLNVIRDLFEIATVSNQIRVLIIVGVVRLANSRHGAHAKNMRVASDKTLEDVVRVIPIEDRDKASALVGTAHPHKTAILPEVVIGFFFLLSLQSF